MIIEQVFKTKREENIFAKHLKGLSKIKKKQYHPIITKIHKKHKISKKTLFYVKEYSTKDGLKTILKESLLILVLASAVSSLGGIGLESIKETFIKLIPIVILLPTLNDMIGDYGTIISSKVSALLHENKLNPKWRHDRELKKLTKQIIIIALLTGIFSTIISFLAATIYGYSFDVMAFIKVLTIIVLDVLLIVGFMIVLAAKAGIYLYRKKEDPNNFLIPITTSIADLGNTLVLAGLIILIL